MTNSDQSSAAAKPQETKPRRAKRKKKPWGQAKIAIVVAIVTGVFGIIAAVIPRFVPGGSDSSQPPTPPVTSTSPGPSSSAPASPSPSKSPTHSSPSTTAPPPPANGLDVPSLALRQPGGGGIYGVAFTRNGTLATGGLNGSAFLWNLAKPEQPTAAFPDANGQQIFGLTISADGNVLAADTLNDRYSKGSVVVWALPGGKPVHVLTAPGDPGFGNPPALSPDGKTLAAASADGHIYLWNLKTGQPAGTLPDPGGEPDYGIAYSRATGLLAAGNQDGIAYLWNTKQGTIVRRFPGPGGQEVSSVAFSPDGGMLATGETDGNVYLWDPVTGAPIATRHGPKGGVIAGIAFSPRDGIIAAASEDETHHKYVICVWDLSGKSHTLHDPSSAGVTKVAFSPDGSRLAVGDENGSTYLYDMNGFIV